MTLGDWRDISLILLAVEAMLIGLIYGLIFYYLWKGFRVATAWLGLTGLPEGRRYARMMRDISRQYSKKIVRPVVKIEATLTRASRTLGSVTEIPQQRIRR